jgi:hypothetical protein
MGDGLEETLEPVIDTEIEEVVEDQPETLRETLQRSMQELKAENPSDEPIEAKPIEEQPKAKEVTTVQPKANSGKLQKEKEVEPPGQFKLEEKEEFNRLPNNMKPVVKRLVNSYKQERDTLVNDIKQYKQNIDLRARDIDTYESLVKDHLPTWGMQGYTPIQAIAGLVQAQNFIINNPKEAIRNLIKTTGLTAEDILSDDSAPNSNIPDINNHPVVQALQEKINYLQGAVEPVINSRKAQEEAQFNAGVDQIVNAVNSVRNEKDNYGRYLYPKLHDNNFLQSVNSLALDLKSRLNLTWEDATKRAYSALDDKPFQAQVTRPQTTSTVVRSLGPQRGVGAGQMRPSNTNEPLNVGDSVRAALEQLKRGSY